jgi:hypothetical protein
VLAGKRSNYIGWCFSHRVHGHVLKFVALVATLNQEG